MSQQGTLDVERVRRHFDFVDRGRIVTNNAASTQAPRELVQLYQALVPGYENVHRGQSTASQNMTGALRGFVRHNRGIRERPKSPEHRGLPKHDGGAQRRYVLAAHGVPRW